VLAKEDQSKEKYLIAYFTVDAAGIEISPEELKQYLYCYLPDYMVPAYFMQIEKIPLTANGKIDRRALPAPGLNSERGGAFTAPGTEIEMKLVKIWAEVLALEKEKISIHADFFQLGGHSLKATAMTAKIHNVFHVRIPLAEVFVKPSIRQLAEYIGNMEKETLPVTDPNLVLLRKKSAEANHLFLVHDGSGEVEGYVEFCQHLLTGVDFNCWGLRTDMAANHNYGPRDITIEALAEGYIKNIKKVQPGGPYYIAGWSLGGTIAFEIALQLEKMGQGVSFLGLIDAPGPQENWRAGVRPFSLESEIGWVWKYLPGQEIKEKVKKAVDVNQAWSIIADHLAGNHFPVESIRKLIPPDLARVIPNYDRLGVRELIYYLNTGRTLTNARACYIPSEKITAVLHYFRAGQSPRVFRDSWDAYCLKPMKTHEISGSHFSIFKQPHVRKNARLFNHIFSEMVTDISPVPFFPVF
jgi:thioesterase domain-containing protein/acyl carrier protein